LLISCNNNFAAFFPISSGISPAVAKHSAEYVAPVVDSATSDNPNPGELFF